MFSIDRWREVFATLNRNRFRTFVTGLSVAWGIFMLVVLLGFGSGLENNVQAQFADDAVNSIWVRRGQTSIPYEGMPVGRRISFDNSDFDVVRDNVRGVEHITGRYYLRGWEVTLSYQGRHGSFSVRSVHPDHMYLENTKVVAGRFLDELDLKERRKVIAIGSEVSKSLFKGADPLGEYISLSGTPYRVIGVFEDEGSIGEAQQVYIPVTTAQAAYGGTDELHQIMFTVGDAGLEASMRMVQDVRALLSRRHKFDPNDPRALRVRNNLEQFQEISAIFGWINWFIWAVGLGTITAGIVGVSNIMLVSVRERTKEIGLRKAMGATPLSVVSLIVQESIFLTSLSGYVGLVAGVGLLELVTRFIPENDYIRNPEVDFGLALFAMALLVIFGVLAGFFPALQAARVNPIVALRSE